MCFIPLVCWIVHWAGNSRWIVARVLLGHPKTTTAVYIFFLSVCCNLREGARRTYSAATLGSLLIGCRWNGTRKSYLRVRSQKSWPAEGRCVCFLEDEPVQKEVDCEKFYSFIHMTPEEFFAAMYYLLEEDNHGGDEEHASGLFKTSQPRCEGPSRKLRQIRKGISDFCCPFLFGPYKPGEDFLLRKTEL